MIISAEIGQLFSDWSLMARLCYVSTISHHRADDAAQV